MNELRDHPWRLLSIFVAGLAAFITALAVGSYGADGAPAGGGETPVAVTSADPSEVPAVETPTASPSGSGAAGGSTAPAGGTGGESTAPATTTAPADQPEPTHQPAEHTTAPAPDEPEPGPVTSTSVVMPSHNTETPAPGGCGTHCK